MTEQSETRRDLLSAPNVGKNAVAALIGWLAQHGHQLSPYSKTPRQRTGRASETAPTGTAKNPLANQRDDNDDDTDGGAAWPVT